MSCPPDTDAKRLARYFLYRRVSKLWKAGGAPTGHSLVLAGNEASEIGCLRDLLNLQPEFVHFVDVNKAGLEVVQRNWPKAHTFHGPIESAIESLRGDIRFINFDFCGYLNEKAVASIAAASDKIVNKGIVAYTFTRDRENAVTPNWDKVAALAVKSIASNPRYRSLTKDSPEWLDTIRFVGYAEALKSMLGKNYEVVFTMRYGEINHRRMGIIALQNIPAWLRTPAWRKEVNTFRSFDEKVGNIANVDLRSKLRDIAMELTDTLQSKYVADILHLPRPTLAAWQAHKTRGSYGPTNVT